MSQLREFLRHHYIGAIVVGLLAYQGLFTAVQLAGTFVTLAYLRATSSRIFSEQPNVLPIERVLGSVTQAVLFLCSAYFLLKWLYGERKEVDLDPDNDVDADPDGFPPATEPTN